MSGLIKVMRRGAKKPVPLFSRVDEAAQELPRTKGTGKEFMAELKKQPGVKKAELDDRKLSSLESAPKMTKEEFIDKLKEKPAPKIEETIKANPTDADLDARAMELIEKEAEEMTDDRIGRWDRSNSYEWLDYKEGAVQYLKSLDYDKYLRQAKRDIEENGGVKFTKYEGYKLPGGENYREILLRLPTEYGEGSKIANEIRQLGYKGDLSDLSYRNIKDMGGSQDLLDRWTQATANTHYSGHWTEPNVLAHMRVQDRVGPNGEKILHVEEIQSDWHQEGRKKGYGDTINEQGHFNVGVPDAPFKKNWHELATKRLMNYAIENGYDKVAFTPGAEQASRYDLSRHLNEINYHQNPDGTFTLVAVDKNGRPALHESGISESRLESIVGKELAQKIVSGEGKDFPVGSVSEGNKSLSGLDLQIGGEGMKGFYDKIIPNYLTNEYGKYGVTLGRYDIPVPPKDSMAVQEYTLGPEYISGRATWDELLKANPSLAKEYAVPLHSIDITPQMREAIEAKGQPLYQAVGIGLTGAAAAPKEEVHFSDNPDAMMMEMEDKGFAGGGLLRKAARASAKEAATPAVNRVDMNYKDVTKRVPELTEAAKKIPTGELSAEEYAKLVNQFKPVTPYKFVPQPATEEDATRALTSNKKAMFGKTKEIPAGQIADLRLDIPAYKDHGVWVNSVHRKDEPTVYGSVSSVKNATMFGAPEKALRVATGEAAKGPWAVISGEWNPIDEADAVKSAQKYLKHKDWRQVGYDPERHGYFYDRETMAPVVGAEEVIQIGPLVLAKKPTLGDAKDFPFREGGEVKIINKVQGALTKAKRK